MDQLKTINGSDEFTHPENVPRWTIFFSLSWHKALRLYNIQNKTEFYSLSIKASLPLC